MRGWALALAVVILAVAVLRPHLLGPLNRAWFRFGLVLHRVTSPVILGLLFFLVFTPMGLIMRAARRDPLRLRWDPAAPSYWIDRVPPGPAPETMRNQF